MPRTRRLHLPGAGFHITARTQERAEWFVPKVREEIVADILDDVPSFGHTLLGYAVMPNHIHIVLKQGDAPLGWVMQRILQRIVKKVRRSRGGSGHVFGEPYWSGTCASSAYLRRAIIYTHVNPTRAGISKHPAHDEWTSHNMFMRACSVEQTDTFPAAGMMLFANQNLDVESMKANYSRYIERAVERIRKGIPGDWLLPNAPSFALLPQTDLGDAHFVSSYSAYTKAASHTQLNIDVTAMAKILLPRISPDLTLDDLRRAGRVKELCKKRVELIAALIQAGCRTAAIARCLRVSQSLVSNIRSQMRG
jgi:REP element-mobilizing transposase RayT